MNSIQNKKIAIIGGGPGGLTLARLLQMNGADVKVYERDLHKDARPKGATLDLHEESGLAALREAGLMDEFNKNYRPGADKIRIVDNDMIVAWDDHTLEGSDRSRPEIDRGPLQQILLDSLLPGTVEWDNQFVSLTQKDGSWQIDFKKGKTAFADLVIAADGANSKVRPYITPITAFYSGYMAIEGAVYHSETACPKMHKLLNGGKIFAFGSEKTLIVSSKGDGSLVFYTGFKASEHWIDKSGINLSDKTKVINWFKKEYADWNQAWLELFENAETQFIPRPLYCMPFDQDWPALPNLTILGDAAHLMPPFAGEGVNMAMLDALELSKCLLNPDLEDTLSAISAYEKQMRARASEVADQSVQATIALHAPDAIANMLAIIS